MVLPAESERQIVAITGNWKSVRPMSGGDIASVMLLEAERGSYVLKTHSAPPEGFFNSEVDGLSALRARSVKVPTVFAQGKNFLLMEYLMPARSGGDDFAAGVMLAELHRKKEEFYGAEKDNYLATILQPNYPTKNWAAFFISARLEFCLNKLRHITESENERWQKFFAAITPLLESCPYPSWLHGDLWAGNLLHSERGPFFIDPACYAGDALVDLAMTRLFGGFSPRFYEGYHSLMPRRAHEEKLLRIYQLYPLLIHSLLFDGADARYSGYYRRVCAVRAEVKL